MVAHNPDPNKGLYKYRKEYKMGKFVYLSFIQWHPGGNRELMEKIVSNMKHEKVELLHHGPSYGTIEDYVFIHSTDLDVNTFATHRGQACTVDDKNWIAHARTVTSVPW